MAILPWRKYAEEGTADKATLFRWRQRANKVAREKGARWACDLCKRGIGNEAKQEGVYGTITLRAPSRWLTKPRRRKVCYACWVGLDSILDHLETKGASDHLPSENFGVADDGDPTK